ncbi:F-box domain containing protein [Tanacetum coccineum]
MEKDSNTPGEEKFLRSVALLFRAFLDLHVLYKSSHTAKEMIWHATEKCTEPGPGWFLWDRKGFETIDVCFRPEVNMRADGFTRPSMIFWLRSSLSGWMSRQGYKAMAIHVMKTLNQLSVFKQNIMRDPSKEFSRDVILAQLDRLPKRVKGKHLSYVGVKIKRNIHDDMLKAQIKVVDILCDLELIYPHALFNTMIHLVIHLLLEALEGGHIRPRWMFPFERYMKKIKVYFLTKTYKKNSPTGLGRRRDELRTTQNSGICSPGPDGEMYYGQLQEILEFKLVNQRGVTAPPDIIDVPDEDDDIIDDENALPPDLADSDVEDLINVDDNGVEKMSSANVARSHGGDGGGEDRPPPPHVPTGYGGCFVNRGKQRHNLGGRGAVRLHTRDKTRNLSLKEIAEAKGPVSIQFDVGDKQTLNPLGPHAAQWSNYIREVIRSVPLYYPSWEKVPKERKAALISNIGTLFDLRPHMESPRWTDIYEGINMHLQKAYNTNKASFKAKHWRVDPQTGTYDVEAIRQGRPEEITADEWDKYIRFWNDPKNLARAAQNRQNRQKSVVISRQGSRSLARLRDEMRQSSDTQEYPSLIDTFWRTHTVDGVFPKDEDRRIYEEMKKGLRALRLVHEDESIRLAKG